MQYINLNVKNLENAYNGGQTETDVPRWQNHNLHPPWGSNTPEIQIQPSFLPSSFLKTDFYFLFIFLWFFLDLSKTELQVF